MKLPGVREVLTAGGFPADGKGVPPIYLELGKARHEACDLFDAGELEWDSVDERILPQIKAWESFRNDYPHWKLHHTEGMYESELGYCGRVDRVYDTPEGRVVLDLKGKTKEKWHALQVAGYSLLLCPGYNAERPAIARCSVYLHPEGYERVMHENVSDYEAFMACLRLWQWRNAGKNGKR